MIVINFPIYASLAGGTLILLQTALMMAVGFRRIKHQQGIGDGGHSDLTMLVRRHGNLAENSGIFLVVLALLEMMGGTVLAVAGLGGAFVFARLMHAIGLSFGDGGPNAPRFLGSMGTMLTGFGVGSYLLFTAATHI